METRIRLGKIEYSGFKNCNIFVNLHLNEHKRGVLEFTTDGFIESPDTKSIYAVGQIFDDPSIDTLTGDGKELFSIIKDLWKKYHLNATNKGTKEQMEVLNELGLYQITDFEACCYVLKERGLFEVSLSDEEKKLNPEYANKIYEFGSGWIAEKIPDDDINKIKCIINTFNSTHSIQSTLEALTALEAMKLQTKIWNRDNGLRHAVKEVSKDLVVLDNGVKFKYHELCRELQDMKEAFCTEFDIRDEKDKALFMFITTNPDFTEDVGITDMQTDCLKLHPKIFWRNNVKFINNIYNNVVNARYGDKKEK